MVPLWGRFLSLSHMVMKEVYDSKKQHVWLQRKDGLSMVAIGLMLYGFIVQPMLSYGTVILFLYGIIASFIGLIRHRQYVWIYVLRLLVCLLSCFYHRNHHRLFTRDLFTDRKKEEHQRETVDICRGDCGCISLVLVYDLIEG